jgi:hypothetical protein
MNYKSSSLALAKPTDQPSSVLNTMGIRDSVSQTMKKNKMKIILNTKFFPRSVLQLLYQPSPKLPMYLQLDTFLQRQVLNLSSQVKNELKID